MLKKIRFGLRYIEPEPSIHRWTGPLWTCRCIELFSLPRFSPSPRVFHGEKKRGMKTSLSIKAWKEIDREREKNRNQPEEEQRNARIILTRKKITYFIKELQLAGGVCIYTIVPGVLAWVDSRAIADFTAYAKDGLASWTKSLVSNLNCWSVGRAKSGFSFFSFSSPFLSPEVQSYEYMLGVKSRYYIKSWLSSWYHTIT